MSIYKKFMYLFNTYVSSILQRWIVMHIIFKNSSINSTKHWQKWRRTRQWQTIPSPCRAGLACRPTAAAAGPQQQWVGTAIACSQHWDVFRMSGRRRNSTSILWPSEEYPNDVGYLAGVLLCQEMGYDKECTLWTLAQLRPNTSDWEMGWVNPLVVTASWQWRQLYLLSLAVT